MNPMIPNWLFDTPKEVKKALRDLSPALSGVAAQQVIEILEEKLENLKCERMEVTSEYRALKEPTAEQRREYENAMKRIHKTWERLNVYLNMFDDLKDAVQEKPMSINLV